MRLPHHTLLNHHHKTWEPHPQNKNYLMTSLPSLKLRKCLSDESTLYIATQKLHSCCCFRTQIKLIMTLCCTYVQCIPNHSIWFLFWHSDYDPYFNLFPIQGMADQFLFWSRTPSLVNLVSMMNSMGINIVSSANLPSSEIINDLGSNVGWCGTDQGHY